MGPTSTREPKPLPDIAALAPHAHQVLKEAEIAGLPNRYRGKVRDNYDLPDGRRILVTTDRISAFDRPLAVIPFKGEVLTRIARFWFERTEAICPNHVLAYPDPNVVVGRRLDILPVEIVVRGYLAGTTSTSILTRYRQGAREVYGHRLPDGLRPNEALRQAIITPTTKAADGGHDEPLTEAMILDQSLLTADQWHTVSEAALALFAEGQRLAAERGLILADTKYEFGTDAEGRIVLADEIHTPDSSRYWFAASYAERFAAGEPPESFDKDFVRNWVVARCDPYRDPIPEIPAEVVLEAAAVYLRAFELITGETFVLPDPAEDPLDRVRRNLAGYLGMAL
ncbi:phosphoribosylaminoimidazole-succinocarboxamide synthase [Aureimonas endophytica]|uniref:Phosphoribosylaminoimidazole-succinocarboxamide synthase n=1 Tax=Aureimonas endophytica TaxID=2027858 RepID=A0A916ZUG2_9HYPH|nr:phosphoribosylaminoimidazolesuccinocarboxamide synthase [Aureimonas endophytica]GGE14777.1 phosphoribosylaminoimidazole-succinocarboxamide synthase [Aureimonas endophytica]